MTPTSATGAASDTQRIFLKEVLEGLRATPKRLPSKYFYDAAGDRIFQQIMRCPEYYLTRCEDEILQTHAAGMMALMQDGGGGDGFDVIELGAGDASKSVHLLRRIAEAGIASTYLPIDISSSVIRSLEDRLPGVIPGLAVHGLNGEYLPMLRLATTLSPRRKMVLFMGANIGNMQPEDAAQFCRSLRGQMNAGDVLIIGFDLKKSPAKILAAYNDAGGFTRDFNLNLLRRMARELHAGIDAGAFYHYPTYDPDTGACKSYLVSAVRQQVTFPGEAPVLFEAGEPVQTEISQKYRQEDIAALAAGAGFRITQEYPDAGRNFVVCAWAA